MTNVRQWDTLQSLLTSSPWSGSPRRSKMGHFQESIMMVESWLTFRYINMACYTFLESLWPKKNNEILYSYFWPHLHDQEVKEDPKQTIFQESIMMVESWWTFMYINMACYTFLESLWPKKNNEILYSYFWHHLHDQEVKEDPKQAIFRNLSWS